MAIPNTTYDTAIVIPSLPFSVSTTANDGGVTYDLWYRYHAPVWTVPSVFAYAFGLGYHPVARVFTVAGDGSPDGLPGDAGSPAGVNVPITFPAADGTDYFIQIDHSGPPASDSVLEMDIVSHVAQVYPADSLLVPDDTFGFQGAVLDPTTGDVARFLPDFDAGEAGDALADGTMLVENYDDDTYRLRDGCFGLLLTIDGALLGVTATGIREVFALHSSAPKFYVGAGGSGGTPASIRTVSPAGVIGATVWTLPTAGLTSLGVNSGETIAYVTGQSTSLSPDIVRWDLVNNVALAPWTPGGTRLKILVLSNDHLVVSSVDATTHVATVREFDSSQALLHTYTFPNVTAFSLQGIRLKPSADEPLSVWVWLDEFTPGGFSTFIKLRLSDGVHLEESRVAQFEGGASQPAASATPSHRFGPAFSCPFIIVRKPSSACDTPLPPWHVEPRVIRRLRRAPHVSADNTRVFVKVFELDLERGQGLVTGQGSDPIVHLRISRDGGQTWGEEVRLHAGAIGAYTQRVQARRLGHGRDLVFEVTVSDPIAWSLVGAWLQVDGGTS